MIAVQDLSDALVTRFPELQSAHSALLSWRPEPGSYLLLSNVFTPVVLGQLRTPGSKEELAVVFSFVEELAASEGLQDALATALLVPLTESPELLQVAWPFMGETTRRIVLAVARASS